MINQYDAGTTFSCADRRFAASSGGLVPSSTGPAKFKRYDRRKPLERRTESYSTELAATERAAS
jgi:hypothetical protein